VEKKYQQIASLLGNLNPELWVVTASHAGQRGGLIATFAVPASIITEHPRMLLGIARHHYTWELIEQSQQFALHLISRQQLDWIRRFGAQSGRDIDKFEDLGIKKSSHGTILLSDAIGWLECRVETQMDTGDRTVYLGEVIDGRMNRQEPPLTIRGLYEQIPDDLRAELKQRYIRDAETDLINIQQWQPA
jgi:flavin reductase (DIM6/NTAB) family NADH-FMN oxidoreductase RutF